MSLLKTLRAYCKSRSPLEWTVLVLIAIAGLTISLGVYHGEMTAEESVNRLNFEIAANRNLLSLMESVSDIEAAFGSLQDFYHASDEVTRNEFGIFVQRMLKRNPGLQALEWVPRVTNDALSRFVDAARKDGLHNFEITEKDSQGKLIQRSQQTEYFPVYYVEPYRGNEPALGFDAASEPRRRAILDRSRDTGLVIATEQIRLVQEKESQSGFVVFVPVYLKGSSTNTLEERRNSLQGFFMGVFRTADFLSQSFGKRNSDGISLCVYEQVSPGSEQPIYCGIDVNRTDSSSDMRKESGSRSRLHSEKAFDIWGRKWLVICVPELGSPQWLTNTKSPVFSLFGFLALTGMVLTYVSFLQRGKAASIELAETRLRAQHDLETQIKAREATLDALNQNKELLNTVLQAASVGIGLIKDRVIQWTNDAMEPLTGYSPEELVGRPSREFYASDEEYERAGAFTYSEIAVKSKSTIEALFRKKDGTVVEVLMNLSAVNKDDLSAGAVFVLTDISESRKLARQLEENVSRMERAEKAALFGNWEFIPENQIVRLSRGASRIEGTLRAQIPLNELLQGVVPEYVPQLNRAWEDLIEHNKPYVVEFKFTRLNDKREVYLRSIAGIDNKSGKIWGVIQDISSQKLAEESLINSEAKYRMLAENMTDVIWSSDPIFELDYISPSVKELLGYELEDIVGKIFFDLLTDESREKIQPVLTQRSEFALSHETPPWFCYELEFISKDGARVWAEIVFNPVIDSQGSLQGFQGVARDVTERKEADAKLRENEERLSLTLEVCNAGCWEWFIETDAVFFDERFHAMLGYEMGELPTSIKEWLSYHHQGDVTTWMTKAQEYLKGDRATFESEHQVQSKTGDWKWIFTRGKLAGVGSSESQKRLIGMAMDITERKKAEEALAEREVLYRTLFEGALDGIIIIDMEGDSTGRIVSANPEAAKMHGYSLDEFTTLRLGDIETADSVKGLQSRIGTVLSGQLLRGEVTHRRKDGSEFPVEISANLVEISGHKYCIGFDRDISERKQSEKALQESEAKFRSYVESSPIGIFESDSQGRIGSANPGSTVITGYSHDELMQMNIMDAVAPSHIDKCSEAFEHLKVTGQVAIETEVITSTGNIVWEYVTGVKLSDNRYLFFSQDITNRKKAELELQAASNRTLQLMKSMINGFVVFESVFDEAGEFVDCRYLYTNDAFDQIQGLSGKDLIGKTIYEVWPDTEQAWIQNFKDVALSGIGKSFEMYHAPTRKYYYCTVYRPWESNDQTCLIFEDITERKHAQEELLEMERKLLQSQKLESLGVLAGGIAHDFNNLLAVIIGNIELAQEIDFDSAEKTLFLERAMSASMKSAGLIRQMLDYSGKGAFEFSDVNLSELVDNNIDMFRMTVPKNINFSVESSDDDIFVKADTSQIQQVIMNLLINASEALEGKNGTIEITTGAQYCDISIISKSLLPEKPKPQDMAFIMVRDDGCGMEGDTVNRIFDPFFSTKFVGRGLGMSVVHGVVRGHSGAVTIESHPGVGTTITVYLPLLYRTGHADGALYGPKSRTALTEEKSPERKKFSVLVVDDEQEVLDLVLRQLGHLGCQTLSAMNGKEALDVFTQNPEIDLVILDLVMPEMGGVETFDRLKRLQPDLMIVICSGYNEEKIKDDFKSGLTPTAFIMKPYRLEALKDLLELLRGERPVSGKEPSH